MNYSWTWDQYVGNLTWLPKSTIFLTNHGSHAYGTSLPTSDHDVRGIMIAPKEYYLGCTMVCEQAEQSDPDLVIYELRKFMKLGADANPNVLELLYTDPSDHHIVTPIGQMLLDNRDLFLSKKVRHTFQGYAHSQMKRIATHRRWLLNPRETQPTRDSCGLPERTVIPADQLAAAHAAIKKRVDEWNWHALEEVDASVRIALQEEFTRRLTEITNWGETNLEAEVYLAACKSLGFDSNFIQFMDKERLYANMMREYTQYQHWKKTRNPGRAELEAKFGFDTKHGMHLVRLSRCCKELLLTGTLQVRRPDAEELLAIRRGAWSYEMLMDWFTRQDVEIEEALTKSTLPHSPNRQAIDNLCVELVEESFRSSRKSP